MTGQTTIRSLGLFLAAMASRGQSLHVYSELQRIDPAGQVVAADRGGTSREILSPAVARNAYASFHVVIEAPKGVRFTLFVGQNPENFFRVTCYRELHEPVKGALVPNRLEPVALPWDGQIAGDRRVEVIWMDVWVRRQSPVERAKLEPELWVGDRWLTYPMEVRVMDSTVPDGPRMTLPAPSADAPADTAALAQLGRLLCGHGMRPAPVPALEGRTVGALLARNAAQDMALAVQRPADELWMHVPATDRAKWCKMPSRPAGTGAEWYLRVRDWLLK